MEPRGRKSFPRRPFTATATHAFDPAVNMRYARVNVTAQSINNFAHIYEITLYKTPPSTTSETGYLQQVGAGAGDLSGNTSVAQPDHAANGRSLHNQDLHASLRAPGEQPDLQPDRYQSWPNRPATGIQVTDNLPAGLTFVSASASCSQSNPVTCNLGDLANGASATVSIVVTPIGRGHLCQHRQRQHYFNRPNPDE